MSINAIVKGKEMKINVKMKYNNKKVEVNGILFDSKAERDYYLLCILPLIQSGEIKSVKFHPKYVLLPAFKKNGRKYRAITYFADFEVVYRNGKREVIDVKGVKTKVFMLKRKLFEHKYKKLHLKVVRRNKCNTNCDKMQ